MGGVVCLGVVGMGGVGWGVVKGSSCSGGLRGKMETPKSNYQKGVFVWVGGQGTS